MTITARVEGRLTGLRRLRDQIARAARGAHVDVGIFAGATYPDGTPVAEVAAYHEFGTATIPSRPFLRKTANERNAQWLGEVTTFARGRMAEQAIIRDMLGVYGEIASKGVQASINAAEFDPRPLKEKTIKEKQRLGFSAHAEYPLIRTGLLMRSINYRVTVRGETRPIRRPRGG